MDWRENDNKLEPEKVKELLEVTVKSSNNTRTEVINCTINNFVIILKNDRYFRNVCYDTMREAPIIVKDLHSRRLWVDKDFSQTRLYIEQTYNLTGKDKLNDAFNVMCSEREYSPVQEIIKSIKWDGKKRCENFFINWAKSPDDDYSRECGRLFFAQGIARAFAPGAKCDYVVVMYGDQGTAKSTLTNWLAIDDDFYLCIRSIEGKDPLQQLCGKWIVEIAELLATTKSGSDEQVKQFISNQIDNFRQPYAHYPVDHKRSCVFLGTTNKPKFLSDPTGNRRWFPLENNQDANCLFDNEQKCKADILQCWAEMYEYWKSGSQQANTYPNRTMKDLIEARQEAAEEDDPELGMIKEYLIGKEKVCLAEVLEMALHYDLQKVSKKDRTAISSKLTGKRIGCTLKMNKSGDKPSPEKFEGYGSQQAYYVPEHLRNPKESKEADEKTTPSPSEPIPVQLNDEDLPW